MHYFCTIFFKVFFFSGGATVPFPDPAPTLCPFLFQISGSATAGVYKHAWSVLIYRRCYVVYDISD